MNYRGLAEFLEALQDAGQLTHIEAKADAKLEIAEIAARLSSCDPKAVLFSQVDQHPIALVTNLYSTTERICAALDAESLEQIAGRLFGSEESTAPTGLFGRLAAATSRTLMETPTGDRFEPISIATGICQQVVQLASDVRLDELPALQLGPRETVASITSASIVSQAQPSSRSHLSRCDLRIVGQQHLALDWNEHDDVARDFQTYREKNEKMPVAVVLGGHPAIDLAAIAPLGRDADAMQIAGQLADRPIDVVSCRTQQLDVPATAEIVIEGFIDPEAAVWPGGEFVSPTRFYHTSADLRRMQVTAMTHRANPVFPAIIVGRPESEQQTLARSVHRILMPWIEAVAPEVVDCALPSGTVARSVAFVSIRKTFAQQARKVAAALWGHPWLMQAKLLVLLDEEVDVNQPEAVIAKIATHADPQRDLFFHQGPGDRFDHAAAKIETNSAMAIDATTKRPGEHAATEPEAVEMSQEIRQRVTRRWSEYGLADRRKE